MKRTSWTRIAQSVCAAGVLIAGSQAQAVVILGSNGSGGVNAYELVNSNFTYAGAIADAAGTPFAGAPSLGVGASGITAQLATFSNSKEFELIVSRRAGASNDSFIGLADDSAFAAGAFEDGNNSGGGLAANGAVALAGQRGAGWANVTGTGLNRFHQRTPGNSIWNGGEPNNAGAENVAQVTGGGLLNDIPAGNSQTYIREWNLNLAESSIAGWKVQDIRGLDTNPSNVNYVNLARNPTGPNVTMTETFHQTINFGVGAGEFGGGEDFVRGGGDNFLIRGTAFIKIPTSGIYTINGAHDDAFFVSIGTSYSTTGVGIDEQNCCGSNPRQVFLTAGVYAVEVIGAEFGGGEHFEFGIGQGTLANGSPALALAGSAGHPAGIQIHQSAAALGGLTPVSPQASIPTGWQFQVQTLANSPGLGLGGTLDNLAETVALINGGGPAEGSGIVQTIDLGSGQFPGGSDNFAFYAKGFVDVLDPSGIMAAALHVSSDDGFRLLVNGVVVSQLDAPTGDSNTISAILNLKENDLIELFVFEIGGGEQARLRVDFDGLLGTTGDRQFLGNPLSGIIIRQQPFVIPEPATALMGLMGVLAIGARRRRVA